MKRNAGMSAVELMVGVVIVALVVGAVARAYSASLDYQSRAEKTRNRIDSRVRFEDRLAELLRGATLTGPNTCVISPVVAGDASGGVPEGQAALPAGSASLTFTTISEPPRARYLTSQETDFNTLNQLFGPQGGPEEIELSMIAVGDAGLKKGLFMRQQMPADSDPKQGGTEFDLNPDLGDIRFEFYDGTQWQTTWDTTTDAQKGKLPTAFRVTYVLRNEQQPHSFIVRTMNASPPASSSSSQGNQQPGGSQ